MQDTLAGGRVLQHTIRATEQLQLQYHTSASEEETPYTLTDSTPTLLGLCCWK